MRQLQNASQLSTYLRALRKARGITQRDLGARLGVSAMRISAIESDPGSVSFEQLLTILHHLDSRVFLDTQRDKQGNARTPTTGEW